MKNWLFCFLMALVVPGFGQDLSVDIDKKGVYQIYSSPKVIPDKVLIDSLLLVDKDIPSHLILEAYQKGIVTYDSNVIAMNYSYKDLWLKRTKKIDYKMAVYYKDTKALKAVTKTGVSSNTSAIENYFLLFSLLIAFLSLLYVVKGNYSKDYIHEKGRFGLFMFIPVVVNFIVAFIISLVIGNVLLWCLCSALLVLLLAISCQSEYNWTQKKYLNYQKVNFLLTVAAMGIIASSIILVIVLFTILALIFFLLSQSAFYKIIGFNKRKNQFDIDKYRQYSNDSEYFQKRYFRK